MDIYKELLSVFITILYGNPVYIGSSSLVTMNASQQFLKPSFTTNYNNTTLSTFSSATAALKTDGSRSRTAFIEGTPKETEYSLNFTGSNEVSLAASSVNTICPSMQNASALESVRETQEGTASNSFEFSPNVNIMSLTISSGGQYHSKHLLIQATTISSVHVRGTEMTYTNSSKGSTADQKSHIFALVFGVFGGFLVLGIAAMIFRNLYTKSKNKVKKIKKKKAGTV